MGTKFFSSVLSILFCATFMSCTSDNNDDLYPDWTNNPDLVIYNYTVTFGKDMLDVADIYKEVIADDGIPTREKVKETVDVCSYSSDVIPGSYKVKYIMVKKDGASHDNYELGYSYTKNVTVYGKVSGRTEYLTGHDGVGPIMLDDNSIPYREIRNVLSHNEISDNFEVTCESDMLEAYFDNAPEFEVSGRVSKKGDISL